MDGFTFERREEEGGATLVLAVRGDLTIPFAGEFRRALLDAFDRAARVVVDVAGVSAVDLTGLQLLCSAHRSSYARNKALCLTGDREGVFADAASLAGFARHVGCDRDVRKNCIWTGGER